MGHLLTNRSRGQIGGHLLTNRSRGKVWGHLLTNRSRGQVVGHLLTNRSRGQVRRHLLTNRRRGKVCGHLLTNRSRAQSFQSLKWSVAVVVVVVVVFVIVVIIHCFVMIANSLFLLPAVCPASSLTESGSETLQSCFSSTSLSIFNCAEQEKTTNISFKILINTDVFGLLRVTREMRQGDQEETKL